MTPLPWQQIEPLDERAHRIEEGGYVSYYLLQGSKRSALIDCGFGLIDPRPLIEPLARKDLLVLNTHVHPDHSNGNRWFADSTVMGRLEWQTHGRKWNANTHRIPDGGWRPSEMILSSGYADRLPEAFDPEAYDRFVALGLPEPVRLLEDGEVVDLGGVRLEAWLTPSHTRGHLCFYEPQRRWLFVGDAIARPGPVWLHLKCRASSEQMDRTYRLLADRADRVDRVFAAHGQIPLDGSGLKTFFDVWTRLRAGEGTGREVQTVGGPGVRFDLDGWGLIVGSEAVNDGIV